MGKTKTGFSTSNPIPTGPVTDFAMDFNPLSADKDWVTSGDIFSNKYWNQVAAHNAFHQAYIETTKYKKQPSVKILGAQGVVFQEITIKASDRSTATTNGLTQVQLDTTTYKDRAIIELKNDLGYDAYLVSIKLDGTLIYQYSGSGGELLHDGLRRDDDIRKNGERCMEVGNAFIVDATQCAKIADFWWKQAGTAHHMYSVFIPGFAYWYEVGEWYNLKIGEADTNEHIDSVVEVYSVDSSRDAGQLGGTTILFREVVENWSKSTPYIARLISGGSPKRRTNRSNIVTVASSTYDGTYDYRCDGTADNVQIQMAIDYVYNTWGGGTVQLTDGNYVLGATGTMKSKVILQGVGNSTVLKPASASVTTMIDFGTATGAMIRDFAIDGDGSNITFSTSGMKVIDGNADSGGSWISIKNYAFEGDSGSKTWYAFSYGTYEDCHVISNVCTNSGTAAAITSFFHCITNRCSSNSNSASTSGAKLYGFDSCQDISSCSVYSNATTGENGLIEGFIASTNIASCSFYSNTTSGNLAKIYGFYLCQNISSCKSYLNTTTAVAGVDILSFNSCTRIVASSTEDNVATGTEYGFMLCKSVQQCNSTDDSSPYGSGGTQSYSDAAGTAGYECADSPDGGFNS